ncbi:uncharacterized protein ELE39_000810 [Cryptosporidium sp. chipmunk genotype I]|uniref:uncharacterized protein n=1 Tax=Cryptosporidium sp. chipmunk genotype I TaxID=1280935 RepID=UPI00351A94CF|nr:hypothetical protein ELE39_000810 [Cryptosporidium sp. chipmunk genotype I]
MPIKYEDEKLNIDSFPFDIPDIGSGNPIEDENSSYSLNNDTENLNNHLNSTQNLLNNVQENDLLKDFYVNDTNITKG